jgi:hypothetical protein
MENCCLNPEAININIMVLRSGIMHVGNATGADADMIPVPSGKVLPAQCRFSSHETRQ